MTGFPLVPILDVVVIVLLGVTAYFAARLSAHLKDFRAGRKDLEKLVKDMALHIGKAERAIEGLRESAKDSGRDLQSRINEAVALADDLQRMTETGGRAAAPRAAASPKPSRAPEKTDGFMIRDPDMDRPDEMTGGDAGDDEFDSRAERDLYEALQGRRGRTGAGGRS